MTKWHSGPPPSLGWWPCAYADDLWCTGIRWWNGKYWSRWAFSHHSAQEAGHIAAAKSRSQDVVWSKRPDWWPERSKT